MASMTSAAVRTAPAAEPIGVMPGERNSGRSEEASGIDQPATTNYGCGPNLLNYAPRSPPVCSLADGIATEARDYSRRVAALDAGRRQTAIDSHDTAGLATSGTPATTFVDTGIQLVNRGCASNK